MAQAQAQDRDRDRDRKIILYHYRFSPYARRIVWYLTLRGIPYSECLQPPYLPRPDLRAIGTVYRRIPILAIGRDIYNDTRIIIAKLEELFPSSEYTSLTVATPEQKLLSKLLETWNVDGGIFVRCAQLIPPEGPMVKNPKFQEDRKDFSGRPWSKAAVERGRPEALVEIRGAFELLEKTVFADGRDWILSTKEPSLADIEAVWPLHWLTTLPGALPGNLISPDQFPQVFSWIARFDQTIKAAKAAADKPALLKGDEAALQISTSDFAEPEGAVDAQDPAGFRKGQMVEVWPIDSGFNHKDRGALVALSASEVVVESQTVKGRAVRVHTPRHNFRVRGVEEEDSRSRL